MRTWCNLAAARGLTALPSPRGALTGKATILATLTGKAAILAAVATIMAFPSAAGEDKATSAAYDFWLDTGARPFALSSLSAVDSFAAHPVTYRAGETVTAITPNDGRVALVATAAPSAGSVSFTPTMDGLWRLENSNGYVVLVGVAWGLFGEAWSYDFNIASLFRMHTQGEGPDRKGLARIFPNVAYSGDHWRRNGAVASTLTLIAPNGQSTNLDLTGTGALWFKFNQSGKWIVRLAMADGTTQEAEIFAFSGFTISIR